MRRRGAWAVHFCLIAILLFGGCVTRQESFLAPPPIPFRLGLCEDYPEETRTFADARADLLLVAENDLPVLRVALGWDGIETRPGEYDWRFWDYYVATAAELGVELIPYVCYTPDWAARTEHEAWKQPPRDMDDFGNFMDEVATRYRGRVLSWELWNEPDNPAYWTGTVEEFAELTRVGSAAVRRADPNARVVSGGLAWNVNFLDELLEHPGVLESLDVINLHNYFETWSPEPIEEIDDYVSEVDRLLERAGSDKEIWLAEVGYSNFRPGAQISETYTATYAYEHTASFQASSLFRMLVPVLATGKVSTAAWYRINDLPVTEGIIGDANNRHLGVLTTDRSAKPSLHSLRFFQELFGSGVAPANEFVRVTSTLQSDAETHAFINRRGELVIVTWLKIITPQTPVSETGTLNDMRAEQLTFDIPAAFMGSLRIYDATGREMEAEAEKEGAEPALETTIRGGVGEQKFLGAPRGSPDFRPLARKMLVSRLQGRPSPLDFNR